MLLHGSRHSKASAHPLGMCTQQSAHPDESCVWHDEALHLQTLDLHAKATVSKSNHQHRACVH